MQTQAHLRHPEAFVPITYVVDDRTKWVFVRGEGQADVAHCEVVARALAADLHDRPGWPILCDFRELAWVPWPHEVRQLSQTLNELRDAFTGPLAVVVEKPAVFGMARMLSTLVEPFGIRMMAFRELDEAVSWCRKEAVGAVVPPAS